MERDIVKDFINQLSSVDQLPKKQFPKISNYTSELLRCSWCQTISYRLRPNREGTECLNLNCIGGTNYGG